MQHKRKQQPAESIFESYFFINKLKANFVLVSNRRGISFADIPKKLKYRKVVPIRPVLIFIFSSIFEIQSTGPINEFF